MRTAVFIFILAGVFQLFGTGPVNPEEIVHCEPSIIFGELFALEDPYCFSYAEATDPSVENEQLKSYLDSHPDDTEQHYFRLSYYLRTRSFFPALITFIHMVNIGATDSSVLIFEKEFSNIIAGGIKESRSSKAGKMYGDQSPDRPMSITEFSTNFFAVLSYLASQDTTPPGSKEDTDLKILSMAFKYTFSNFFNGIDLEKDSYLKELFSRLIVLKNKELMENYLEFFFYFSKGRGTVPHYSSYSALKKMGAVTGMNRHMNNRIASERMKKLFASFYLDNMENMPQIEFTPMSEKTTADKNKSELCGYLSQRETWLRNLKFKDPEDISYNESIKIVEQCPGTFRFPIVLHKDRIVVGEDNEWMVDIAVALKYLVDNDVDQKSAESILKGAVSASLSKTGGPGSSEFADMLFFFYYTDKSADLLFALYSKQIGKIKKDVSDSVNWAAEFLSSSLF